MPDSEMIERVAKAIYEAKRLIEGVDSTWDEVKDRAARPDGYAYAKLSYAASTNAARAAIEAMMEPVDVRCPFCGEDGFDKIGLKIHLHWCAAYEETPLADPPAALSPSLKEQEDRTP